MGEPLTTPPDVVAALSLLNSHARAFGCGRDAIYSYKLLVAMLYASAGQANARPVGVMSKCRYCNGTGKFFSWDYGQTDEACRKCSRTGYVFLRFVETRIEGHSWHHPWISYGQEIFSTSLGGRPRIEYDAGSRSLLIIKPGHAAEEMSFGSVGDWTPNTPGEKMAGERAAELLNPVEDWVLSIRGVDPQIRWRLESALRTMSGYNLELGRIGTGCHYCESQLVTIGQRHILKPFSWAVCCCADHERMPIDQWDKRVPPSALTISIVKWAERRAATSSMRASA